MFAGMNMDAEAFGVILISLVYLGFAIRNGIRISVDEARRFFRIELGGGVFLLFASILFAVDIVAPFLPDIIAIPIAILWVAAFTIAFYSLFLGIVLLFRERLRYFGIRILSAAGLPLALVVGGGRFL